MGTMLCIQVSSTQLPQKQELELLYNEEWTASSEELLLQRLHEILELVRDNGVSIKVHLDINVKDPSEAVFLLRKKLNHFKTHSIQHHKLSIREIEILGLIMLGYTNHEIADKLFISYETVRSHRKNILTKTGACNTAALINYYHQTFFEK
ncbi:MAG: response regulator transcription factor [Flavisolibacter sp.]